MKTYVFFIAVLTLFTSCNVTESIVFNKDMGGEYKSSFDLSPMMNFANSQGSASDEAIKTEKIDTTIVFSELFETHKDSVAALSGEQRARLEKLKGMTMQINSDEANGIFDFSMIKPFKSIKDLENISEQMTEAFTIVQDVGNKDGQAPKEQLDGLMKTDKVDYAFVNNTFSRFQPDSASKNTEGDKSDEDLEDEAEDDFGKHFEMQFEEVFSSSHYTLIYSFPRKVKSVSHKEATISEDGKTVTYKVPWSAINKDDSLMNLNVVLED